MHQNQKDYLNMRRANKDIFRNTNEPKEENKQTNESYEEDINQGKTDTSRFAQLINIEISNNISKSKEQLDINNKCKVDTRRQKLRRKKRRRPENNNTQTNPMVSCSD
jgi:hypothetical protein